MYSLTPVQKSRLKKLTEDALGLQVSELVRHRPWFIDMVRRVEEEILRIVTELSFPGVIRLRDDFELIETTFGARVELPLIGFNVHMFSRDEYEGKCADDKAIANAVSHTIHYASRAISCLREFWWHNEWDRLLELLDEMNVLYEDSNDRLFQELADGISKVNSVLNVGRTYLRRLLDEVWTRNRVLEHIRIKHEAYNLVNEALLGKPLRFIINT